MGLIHDDEDDMEITALSAWSLLTASLEVFSVEVLGNPYSKKLVLLALLAV